MNKGPTNGSTENKDASNIKILLSKQRFSTEPVSCTL